MFSFETISVKVAFHIFTNGTKTLGLNLTQRFKITDEGELVTENEYKNVIKEKTESFNRSGKIIKSLVRINFNGNFALFQPLKRWSGRQSNRARTQKCSSQSCAIRY